MKTWSRRHTLIAGLALITITNVVALIGVAYNRSGAPESELRLTQRELRMSWRNTGREDSGLEVELAWRVLQKEKEAALNPDIYYPAVGAPGWLDASKLAELGFDTSKTQNALLGRRHFDKQLPKAALLVLEFDGPAYQQALKRAQERVEQKAKPGEGARDEGESAMGGNSPAERLNRERNTNSRLFVVDAGLDAAVLRAKYPDRDHYAIVNGRIRVIATGGDAKPQLAGYIDAVSNDQVSVPLEFRNAFGPDVLTKRDYGRELKTPVGVTLVFGKRFEPWITAASRGK